MQPSRQPLRRLRHPARPLQIERNSEIFPHMRRHFGDWPLKSSAITRDLTRGRVLALRKLREI